MLVPPEYLTANAVFGAGAGPVDVYERDINQPPLCIVALQSEAVLPAARLFAYRVRTADNNNALEFMRKSFSPTIDKHVWKDFNCPSGGVNTLLDMQAQCIVIPPGGALRLQAGAGAVMTVIVNVQAYELTKFIISRTLLATAPGTVGFSETGKLSVIALPPEFAAQGGGVPT